MKTFQHVAIVMGLALGCSVWLNLSHGEPIRVPKKPGLVQIKASDKQMKKSQENLEKILLAMHKYAEEYNQFPVDVVDEDGKPILSWRVLILSYFRDEEPVKLYKKFRMDEPWDSEHNKPLSDTVLSIYNTPGHNEKEPVTFYKHFAGPGTVYQENTIPWYTTISDGTANTCAVIEAGPAVPWAKPGDFMVDVSRNSKKDLPELQFPYSNVRHCATFYGNVHKIPLKIKPDILRAFITPRGGEETDVHEMLELKD